MATGTVCFGRSRLLGFTLSSVSISVMVGGKFVRDVVSDVVVSWLRYVSAHRIWTGDKVVAEQIQGKTLVGVLLPARDFSRDSETSP